MDHFNPGKYDKLCTLVRDTAVAEGAIVIVINGLLGSGFSVQTTHTGLINKLPAMLEQMAADIRADLMAEKTRMQ
jgi:hypothetical protein